LEEHFELFEFSFGWLNGSCNLIIFNEIWSRQQLYFTLTTIIETRTTPNFAAHWQLMLHRCIRYSCLKSNLFIQGVKRKIIWATLYSVSFNYDKKCRAFLNFAHERVCAPLPQSKHSTQGQKSHKCRLQQLTLQWLPFTSWQQTTNCELAIVKGLCDTYSRLSKLMDFHPLSIMFWSPMIESLLQQLMV